VKPRALEPSRHDNSTSVFRTVGIAEDEIWVLGRLVVESASDRLILARADLVVANANQLGLRVERSEPPPRHANITGWPEEKDKRISLAQQLAAKAELVIRPPAAKT